MAIPIRRKTLIPDEATVITKIVKAEQVSGQFGPQICLDLKVLTGKYASQSFKDWAKLSVDEETGQPYIADNTKAWEIVLAANDGDEKKAEKFSNPEELEGKVIMGQVNIRGKATKRNGLRFGTIFAYRGVEDETETEIDELPYGEEEEEEEEEDESDK